MSELPKDQVELLERILDANSLEAVLSGLSYICGEKAEHVATNWQDMKTSKRWMQYSVVIDRAHSDVEDIDAS